MIARLQSLIESPISVICRRLISLLAAWLAITSQVLLPLTQGLHSATCSTDCQYACAAARLAATASAIPAGHELLFDRSTGANPNELPADCKAMLRVAAARLHNQRGQPAPPPLPRHDPSKCLVCLQLTLCRAGATLSIPQPVPALAPATFTEPAFIAQPISIAAIPLPPARAPPLSA